MEFFHSYDLRDTEGKKVVCLVSYVPCPSNVRLFDKSSSTQLGQTWFAGDHTIPFYWVGRKGLGISLYVGIFCLFGTSKRWKVRWTSTKEGDHQELGPTCSLTNPSKLFMTTGSEWGSSETSLTSGTSPRVCSHTNITGQ